jgi:hypothetical protein
MTTLRSLGDLLAVVPYLLGFHPTDSLVLLALRDRRIVFQVRADLPIPAKVPEVVTHLTGLVARHAASSAVLLGYGTGTRVTPVMLALRPALESAGVPVLDALRVADGRYWSYLCTEPTCCPPDGRAYDTASTPVAAEAVVAGYVALPSREELARRLGPSVGPARQAMTEAIRRADERLTALAESCPGDPAAALLRAGRTAVDRAVQRQRAGLPLDDDELAWLTAVLVYLPVRDHAWESVGGDLGTHVGLWTEVVRRCDPELVVAPATLLSFAAWRAGEGALASIALSRALEADPDYRMAQLMGRALAGGLSPAEWALAAELSGGEAGVQSVDSR